MDLDRFSVTFVNQNENFPVTITITRAGTIVHAFTLPGGGYKDDLPKLDGGDAVVYTMTATGNGRTNTWDEVKIRGDVAFFITKGVGFVSDRPRD